MNCRSGKQPTNNERGLADPGSDGVSIWSDIGGRLDRGGSEQFSCPAKQRAHFVELLLQPGISHALTVPRPAYPHNSPHAVGCFVW
jgi:hypothetical protein